MQLANKTVLLTGAGRGIGRAAARRFVEAGCRVALVARTGDALRRLAAELGDDRALPLPADVSDPRACEAVVQETVRRFGGVDVLVNNAAIGIYGAGVAVSLEDLQQVMQVNFFGPLHLIRACLPPMRSAGGGLVITVSSIIGRRATPWAGGYCASKAALERMVEALRVELAAHNIRFSTLYPGVTRTEFVARSLGETSPRRGRVRGVPAERVAARLVWVARREPRDAYVTLFDRLFVTGARLFPALTDRLFRWYFPPPP